MAWYWWVAGYGVGAVAMTVALGAACEKDENQDISNDDLNTCLLGGAIWPIGIFILLPMVGHEIPKFLRRRRLERKERRERLEAERKVIREGQVKDVARAKHRNLDL